SRGRTIEVAVSKRADPVEDRWFGAAEVAGTGRWRASQHDQGYAERRGDDVQDFLAGACLRRRTGIRSAARRAGLGHVREVRRRRLRPAAVLLSGANPSLGPSPVRSMRTTGKIMIVADSC